MPNSPVNRTIGRPIVFYDGECGFCARVVKFWLRRDRRAVLRFAPLQGETYRASKIGADPETHGTMVLVDDSGTHVRSDAGVRIMRHVGGFWGFVGGLIRVVPRPLRDAGYRFIARHRFTWFGKPRACDLPTEDEARRLLP